MCGSEERGKGIWVIDLGKMDREEKGGRRSVMRIKFGFRGDMVNKERDPNPMVLQKNHERLIMKLQKRMRVGDFMRLRDK
jgi:hypothetical protein